VLQEPLAHVACGYADDCIFTRVIRRRAPEQFDSDDTLFEGFEMAGDRLVDDVLKKLTASVTSLKCGPFNDFLDVVLEQGDVFRCPRYFR
jgi:hypothetical protein